jgi:hypothetical protein
LKWLAYCIYLQIRAGNAPAHVPRTGTWYGTAE